MVNIDNHDLYKHILNNLYEGVYFVDLNRKILFWNEAAERIRMLVENSFITEGELSINVTISIGATMARKDDTLEKLLKRADELLYESKRNGRNRVTFG